MSEEQTSTNAQPKSHPHLNAELAELREILDTYARPILIAILAVTVAVIAVNRFRAQAVAKEAQAASLLANATSETEMESVINDFPKSKAAPRAILALANLHYSQARYPQAIEQYELFIAEHPKHELLPAAQLGTLIAKAAQTPSDSAAADLAAFAQTNSTSFLVPQATLAQAACLKALGKLDAARILLEDLIASSEESGWTTIADEQLARIQAEIERAANPMPLPAEPEMTPVQLPQAVQADTPGAPVVVLPPATDAATPATESSPKAE